MSGSSEAFRDVPVGTLGMSDLGVPTTTLVVGTLERLPLRVNRQLSARNRALRNTWRTS